MEWVEAKAVVNEGSSEAAECSLRKNEEDLRSEEGLNA
jgi:hypothetical protein